jgi:hypothetical protein
MLRGVFVVLDPTPSKIRGGPVPAKRDAPPGERAGPGVALHLARDQQ